MFVIYISVATNTCYSHLPNSSCKWNCNWNKIVLLLYILQKGIPDQNGDFFQSNISFNVYILNLGELGNVKEVTLQYPVMALITRASIALKTR